MHARVPTKPSEVRRGRIKNPIRPLPQGGWSSPSARPYLPLGMPDFSLQQRARSITSRESPADSDNALATETPSYPEFMPPNDQPQEHPDQFRQTSGNPKTTDQNTFFQRLIRESHERVKTVKVGGDYLSQWKRQGQNPDLCTSYPPPENVLGKCMKLPLRLQCPTMEVGYPLPTRNIRALYITRCREHPDINSYAILSMLLTTKGNDTSNLETQALYLPYTTRRNQEAHRKVCLPNLMVRPAPKKDDATLWTCPRRTQDAMSTFQKTMNGLEHTKEQCEIDFGQALRVLHQDQMYCYTYKFTSFDVQTMPTLSQVRHIAESRRMDRQVKAIAVNQSWFLQIHELFKDKEVLVSNVPDAEEPGTTSWTSSASIEHLFPLHYFKYILERGFQLTVEMLLTLVLSLGEDDWTDPRMSTMLGIVRTEGLRANSESAQQLLSLSEWREFFLLNDLPLQPDMKSMVKTKFKRAVKSNIIIQRFSKK